MGVNLHQKLSDQRSKNETSAHLDVLDGFKTLLNAPSDGARILENLFESTGDLESLNFDALETERIYHISDIKKLCVDYRLRFLDSKHFNGTFPAEALDAVKDFEAAQGREIKGFKMIAPAGMFKLAEKDMIHYFSSLWAAAIITCWPNGVTTCTHYVKLWCIHSEILKVL